MSCSIQEWALAVVRRVVNTVVTPVWEIRILIDWLLFFDLRTSKRKKTPDQRSRVYSRCVYSSSRIMLIFESMQKDQKTWRSERVKIVEQKH